MKFAEALTEVEYLFHFGTPVITHLRDSSNDRNWIACWMDDESHTVKWYTFAISPEDLALLKSKDFGKAISLKTALSRSPEIYLCEANTYYFAASTEGTRVDAIDEQYMPRDGSYIHIEAYTAWEQAQKGNATCG